MRLHDLSIEVQPVRHLILVGPQGPMLWHCQVGQMVGKNWVVQVQAVIASRNSSFSKTS